MQQFELVKTNAKIVFKLEKLWVGVMKNEMEKNQEGLQNISFKLHGCTVQRIITTSTAVLTAF